MTQLQARTNSTTSTLLLSLLALILPPVPVLLRTGCSPHLIINLLLTILAWFPGVLHAWWVLYQQHSARQHSTRLGQRDVEQRRFSNGGLVFVAPRQKDSVTGAMVGNDTIVGSGSVRGNNMQGYYGPPPEASGYVDVDGAPGYVDAQKREVMSEKHVYRSVPVE